MVIPHRLLNPDFSLETGPPALILFPRYQAGSALEIEQMSPALDSTNLMASDVNGRNLKDHGFRQLAALARSVPAFQITYGSFSGFSARMEQLVDQLLRN